MYAHLLALFILAPVFGLVQAGAVMERNTNAWRLAQGLPLKPPRKLFQPTAVDSAARSRRSVPPGQQFTCNPDFANCCATYDGNGNGSGCFFEFSNENSQTCSAGYTGLCCSEVNLNNGDGHYTAAGCSEANA